MRAVTKRLRLDSRGFRYTVALYLSCLHITFDDEIQTEIPSNFEDNFRLAGVQT